MSKAHKTCDMVCCSTGLKVYGVLGHDLAIVMAAVHHYAFLLAVYLTYKSHTHELLVSGLTLECHRSIAGHVTDGRIVNISCNDSVCCHS